MGNHDLTTGVIWKKLILFFLPIAAGTLFQQLYNTVDTMVVGKFVGREALAAVGGSAAQIIALFIGFFVALTGGASAVIAQLAGAQLTDKVSKAVHSAFTFSILAGLGLTVLGLPLAPAVLRLMKTPAETMQDSVTYLRIYFSGTVFMLVFNMGSSILQAVGDSRHPLYYLIASCVCNIVLDLVFVVGFRMGIAGAAYATVISQILSSVLVLHKFCRLQNACHLSLKNLKIDRNIMKHMLMIGVPSGLQASMYSLSNLIIQIAINSLGTVTVAAWTMASKVDGIYSSISTALGVAVMGFVGQNYGAGKTERVRETLRVSLKIFMPLTLLLGVVVMVFGRFGLGIFLDDPEVIRCTQEILWYFVPFYVVWTTIEILSGSLRGIGDAVVPVVITGIGICVFRLLWVWGIFPVFHTLGGLTLCYPISWIGTGIALFIHYRKQGWLSDRFTSRRKLPEDQR